jgi:hypothetical protein
MIGRPTYTKRTTVAHCTTTRTTTRNRSSATPARRSIDERTSGRLARSRTTTRRLSARECRTRAATTSTDGHAVDAATRWHRCGHANVLGGHYLQSAFIETSSSLAPTEKTCRHVHSPLATRSFVPSSDGTFYRLGRRRRWEDANKHSKLSVGKKESSLYGIIARTAIGFGGVDRRRITGGRKVCLRNDTYMHEKPHHHVGFGVGAASPRADRQDPIQSRRKTDFPIYFQKNDTYGRLTTAILPER